MRARRAGAASGALAGTCTVRGVLRALIVLVAATSFLFPLLTLMQLSRPDEQHHGWHFSRTHAQSPPRSALANAASAAPLVGAPALRNPATTANTAPRPVLSRRGDSQPRATPPSPPPPPPPLANASATRLPRDVAIGVAKGLKAEAIRTFVVTLRQFCAADVYLYVDAIPADMPAYDGVHFIVFDQSKLPHPWHRFHPSSYRYHLYHEFMKTTGLQYQRVQACDIRDVAFQADPFRSVRVEEPDAVHIFQEDASMTIGRCGVNSNWIRVCYGVAASKVATQPISCSGYAIGGAAAMARYFEVMAGEIGENQRCEQNGIDQGMHNVLVNAQLAGWRPTHGRSYAGLPAFVSHSNERGPVYTGGYAAKGVYSQTSDGTFLNAAGDTYRVLHQYDRHAYMTDALTAVVARLGAAAPRSQTGKLGVPPRSPDEPPQVVLQAAGRSSSAATEGTRRAAGLPPLLPTPPVAHTDPPEGATLLSSAGAGSPPRALVFVVQLDPAQRHWFDRRHSGEVEFITTLAAALHALGWAVTQSGDIDEVRAYVEAAVSDASQLSRTHLFLDVATATNFYEHAAWPALCCHVRVLDFFGTPAAGARGLGAAALAAGVRAAQFWTPYPNAWNTAVGFPVHSRAPPLKRRQGMLWGKMTKYFEGHKELIRHLAKLSPLHAVVEDAPEGWLKEAGVTVHQLMQPAEWEALVAESAYMIGLGDPILGPSVMHCLAVGTPYLDPVFSSPKTVASGMAFSSQHSFAASFGPPLVYPVHLDDAEEVVATVKRVLAGPPVAPFVPENMTPSGYKAHVAQLMDESFCD